MSLRNILLLIVIGMLSWTDVWGQVTIAHQDGTPSIALATGATCNSNIEFCLSGICPTATGSTNPYVLTAPAGATTYAWTLPAGVVLVSGTLSSAAIGVTIANTATIQLVMTGTGAGTFDIELIVGANPTVTISGAPTYGCNGDNLNLTAGGGCAGCTYSWFNGTTTTTGSTLTTAIPTTGPYVLTLTGEDANGCKTQDIKSVTVRTKPVLTNVAVTNPRCVNQTQTATLTCSNCPLAGATLAYDWTMTGPAAQSNLNSVSNSWMTTGITTNGSYQVQVIAKADYGSGQVCSATLNSANFAVNSLPTFNASANSSTTDLTGGAALCLGSNITLGSNFVGTVGSASWTRSPITFTAATVASSNAPTTAGTYRYTLQITDSPNGCTNTDFIDVEIKDTLNFLMTATPAIICDGGPATITLTESNATLNFPPSNPSFTWSGPNITTTNPTTSITTSTLSTGTYLYSVTISGVNGCDVRRGLNVVVSPNPTVTLSAPSNKICPGNPIVLTGTTTGTVVEWYDNGTALSQTINPLTVTAVNATTTEITKDYVIEVQTGGCYARDTATVIIVPGVTVNIPPQADRCININTSVPANISGGTSPYTYSWFDASSNSSWSGSYATVQTVNMTVAVTDAGGCTSNASTAVNFIACTAPTINASANALCEGDVLQLDVVYTPTISGVTSKYLWGNGNNSSSLIIPITSSTSDTLINFVQVGYIQEILIIDPPGCTTAVCSTIVQTFVVQATLYDTAIVSRPNLQTYPGDTVICKGSELILTAGCINCNGPSSYVWSNGAAGGPTNSNIGLTPNPIITTDSMFSVTVTDIYNCVSIDTVRITAIDPPGTFLSPAPGDTVSYCPTASITLTANPTLCNGCTFAWSTNQSSQFVTVNQQGKYFVTTTNNGCSELDSIVVKLHEIPKPIIVNSQGDTIALQNPPNLFLCGGAPDTLKVDSASCVGCSFTWNTGATTPSLIVNGQGGFFVYAVDTNGCTGVSNPILAINSTIGQGSVATASPAQICNQSPAMLEVTACVGCTYVWHDNLLGYNVGLDTSRFYSTIDTGVYFAEIINPQGCVFYTNLLAIDSILVGKPSISSSTDSLCVGATATLTATSNPNIIDFQWYRNGVVVSGANSFVFTTTQVGNYFLRATYNNGCQVNSDTINITLATFVPTASATNSVICQSQTVDVSTQLNPGWLYQWYRDGILISGAVAAIYQASQPGTYYSLVTTDFGCSRLTDSVVLDISGLTNVNAIANKTSICPGDTALLSVSLCAGCSYEWFNASTGTSLTSSNQANFNYKVASSGQFFAQASDGTCVSNSDTLAVTLIPVLFPSINSTSNIVCNGVNAVLSTPSCNGCDYVWLLNGAPIFGALSDTIYTVSNLAQIGNYQVLVEYTSGCSDTSLILPITDGSYNLTVSVTTDSIICNSDTEILTSVATPSNCGLGCNYQWFKNGVPLIPSNAVSYNAITGGNYKLQMRDSRGCIEESNIIPLTEVNLNPVITAPSNAICGNTAVMLTYTDAATCVGCTYQWQKGGGPATFGVITLPTYTTDTGSLGVGVYSLLVTQLGCTASSNLFPLNQISGLSIPVASTDPNICDGDTATVYRVGGGCVNCQFQWLNAGVPILAATTPSLTVSNPGTYTLEMSIGTSGCRDTSAGVTLLPVPSPIDSFDLVAANLTPLTSTGPIVNLHNAVFPTTVSLNDTFYSQPFNAALGPNSGMSGADREFMNPSIAGAGYHRIYYRYDTLGCKFIYDDILYVFGDPNVNIVNENLSAPQYEACVADTIQLQVFNMPFNITNVYLFDVNNVYTSVPIASSTLNDTIFGIDTVWNGTIRVGIPDWAQASFMMVTSAANADTFITPFILIHNSNLDISGLPNVVCSNGTAIPLSAVPAGGFFTAQYNSGSTLPLGTNVVGAFSGLNFNTGAMTRASYGTDQIQNVRVVYNFNNRYTNGLSCPQIDTVSKIIEARAVFLDSVKYNPISISQDRELLENLVFRVYPYTAQPSQWTSAAVGGTISFAGNYTFPAGNPLDFLPKNAGVGKHAMTYRIHNGVCMNSKTDSINVIAAPNPIGIPDSMCRTQTFANFGRQLGLYSYFDGPNIPIQAGVAFSDTINMIRVRTTNGPNTGLTVIGSATNLELYNYSPAAVLGNSDTLLIEYWYKKIERVGGVPVDTIMYIVGSIVTPIYIETPFPVDIIDSIVANVYCEVDELYLLAGSPSGGVFSLQGGSGAYAAGATVVNNILNPYTVHSPENTNTNYTLTYVKSGAVCQNSDSKVITIPEPLDPTFGTASGKRVFCQTDPTENIVINTVGTFTPVWLINGITQPQPPTFNPNVLNPGNQVVTHLVTDTVFGCTYTAVDTYRINPLPVLAVTPLLDTAYCTNDPNDTVRVSPNPICAQFVSGGLTMLFESFDALGFPWNRQNTGTGNTWVRTTVLPYTGTGAAFVNTSNTVQDAWMFTPTLALTTGHSYQVTVFAATNNCVSPPCLPAQFKVRVAQGQSIAAQAAGTTFGDTSIANTNYQPYIFTYTHTGLSGNYNFSFQCLTGIDGRSLTLDDISIVDASVSGCVLGGVGTMVGPGINYVSDSTYAFNPRIVAPGNYNIRYVYTAAATGCTDSIQMPVRVKPHPITSFTGLNTQYCDNAPIVPLVGTPSGGLFSSTGPNLVSSPFWAFDPNTGFANEIISYTYTDLATNCTTTIRDTTTVLTISDSARISTILPAGYCVNVDSVVLNVSTVFGAPAAGSFYGIGVRNGTLGPLAARFYPDTAVIDGGRYGDFTITYIYPTSNGCIDTTRAIATVHAMPDLSFVSLPDSVCLNAGIIQVRVNNHVITGSLGQIQYDTLIPVGPTFVGGGTYLPSLGLQDTLNPINFGTGWHNMQYTYTDIHGCMSSISDSFRVDTIPVIRFAGLQADRIYCENDVPSLLLAYPPYYPGSGYLQLTSGLDSIVVDSSFYLINPAIFADTLNPNRRWDVYYTFEDLNFCSSSGVDSFFVRPYPRITMAMPPTFCSAPTLEPLMPFVTPQGGIFTDNLVVTGIAQDTMLDLSGTMGPRRITYYYLDTVSTCRNNAYQDVTLYNTPDVDFYALGGCVGANIIFVSDSAVNNLTPGLDSITRVEWIFGDGNNAVVFPPLATEIPNQTYVYATNGVYQVQMAVTNQGQCTDTVTRQLVVSPYVNTYPYVQDFQAGTGNWYQEQPIIVPDTAAVWQRAQLLGNTINDPGNFAWVTRPNAPYTYNQDDRGWVYSPCFDFSNAWRPMIVLDIWRDFLTDVDGAVLEYYDEWAFAWVPVGETDKGINWYQTDFLVSRPGNQPTVTYPRGWTGESSGWEKARYRLDALVGRPNVRFRVAFASDPNTVLEGHEGMAFDSVWIGERGRNVLVEHYSNYYHVNQQGAIMDVIDQFVYDTIYNNNNGRDVSLIQYQTDIVSLDPINAQYSTDFDARVLYYSINANSQIRVDGSAHGTGKSEDLRQWDLEYDMLQFPVFNIQIDPLVFSGNTIQISTTTTALTNLDSTDYSITVAITEDFVYNGRGFPMKSVLRKLLPDATGYTYQRAWTPGQSVSQNPSWVYSFGTLNPNNIQATVYIQKNDTKDVLQVATTRDLSIFPPVGTIPTEEEASVREDLAGINLFPNPASSYFNVTFEMPLSDDYTWNVVDVLGRVVQTGQVEEGSTQIIVESYRLSEGTYFFTMQNEKGYAQRKVVITQRP